MRAGERLREGEQAEGWLEARAAAGDISNGSWSSGEKRLWQLRLWRGLAVAAMKM